MKTFNSKTFNSIEEKRKYGNKVMPRVLLFGGGWDGKMLTKKQAKKYVMDYN